MIIPFSWRETLQTATDTGHSHKCKKRLWISEIQPLPHDEDRAEELRVRRAQRVLCTCSPSERAMVDRYGIFPLEGGTN